MFLPGFIGFYTCTVLTGDCRYCRVSAVAPGLTQQPTPLTSDYLNSGIHLESVQSRTLAQLPGKINLPQNLRSILRISPSQETFEKSSLHCSVPRHLISVLF
jgi:hypothetical protein